MEWNKNLPQISSWQPKTQAKDTLKQSLRLTCQAAQQRIIQEGRIERRFNINAFDSGPGLEDIVRRELQKLLPTRYDVSAGVLNDSIGATAGDCDVLISNRIWAPVVKLGATEESRRFHFPVEAVYAVVEIKQSLTYKRLDDAMAKLVSAARLERPSNPYGHITENQYITDFDREGMILNPLFTAVLSTDVSRGTTFEGLARRFFWINRQLVRDQMVKMLCVLGHGVAFYTVRPNTGPAISADFERDRYQDLAETIYDESPADSFSKFFGELLGHLTRSVLGIHDLGDKYGINNFTVRFVSVDPTLDHVPPNHPT